MSINIGDCSFIIFSSLKINKNVYNVFDKCILVAILSSAHTTEKHTSYLLIRCKKSSDFFFCLFVYFYVICPKTKTNFNSENDFYKIQGASFYIERFYRLNLYVLCVCICCKIANKTTNKRKIYGVATFNSFGNSLVR